MNTPHLNPLPARGEEVKYLRQSEGLAMIKYYIPSPPDLGGEG